MYKHARGLRVVLSPTPLEPPLPTTPIPMRTPCYACNHPLGTVARKSQQVVVSCAACDRYQYNAPKREQVRWWGQTR
jgi:hypothetical protein